MTTSDTHMNVDSKTKEEEGLKLNKPKPFTGKREELKKFLLDIKLYVYIKDKSFKSDAEKIAFTLSFMNEGDAAAWNEQFMEKALSTTPPNLGTWTQFLTDLNDAFKPYDAPGDALEEMKTLRVGNNSIDEHIAKFKMLVTRSGLGTTSPAVIDYFRETLNIPLQRQILSLAIPPATLDEWYTWASRLDNNF